MILYETTVFGDSASETDCPEVAAYRRSVLYSRLGSSSGPDPYIPLPQALRTGASARTLSPRAARSEAIMMLMALLRMPSIACLRSSLASPRTQIRNGQLVVSCDRSNWQILP